MTQQYLVNKNGYAFSQAGALIQLMNIIFDDTLIEKIEKASTSDAIFNAKQAYAIILLATTSPLQEMDVVIPETKTVNGLKMADYSVEPQSIAVNFEKLNVPTELYSSTYVWDSNSYLIDASQFFCNAGYVNILETDEYYKNLTPIIVTNDSLINGLQELGKGVK